MVLSAGTLKSPHLLMLSGVGPADQLQRVGITPLVDVPGVGQNLRDHPNVLLMWRRGPDAPSRRPVRPQVGMRGLPAGLRLRFTADGSTIPDDCMVRSFGGTTMEGAHEGAAGTRMAVALSQETSVGTIRLMSSDPTVLPAVDFGFLAMEDDRSRMRRVLELGLELAAHTAIRQFVDERIHPGPEDLADAAAFESWMLRRVKTGHHLTSTCKMGPDSDELAVVDQCGRVRGVQGVRIADASIMPQCTRQNPQATIMMIGERIADFANQQAPLAW